MSDPRSEVTCLSSDDHDDHKVSDVLSHYMGCLRFEEREKYLTGLSERNREGEKQQIKSEEQRIDRTKRLLAETEDARCLRMSLKSWSKSARDPTCTDETNMSTKNVDIGTASSEGSTQAHRAADGYDVDQDFNAYLIQFKDSKHDDNTDKDGHGSPIFMGKFPNQKISVFNLLRKYPSTNPNPLKRCENKGGKRIIKYFHFPANNMQWIQDAIAKYYGETNTEFDTARQTAEKRTCANTLLGRDFWLGQEQGRGLPTVHARHMRPLCERVSSDPEKVDPKPRNIVLFMPYLHWDLHHQQEYFTAVVDDVSARHKRNCGAGRRRSIISVVNGIQKKRQGRLGTDMSASTTRGHHFHDVANDLMEKHTSGPVTAEDSSSRTAKRGRYWTGSKLGQVLYDAFRIYKTMNNYRDRQLIEKYLNGNAHLHLRRTLDQAHYWTLRNTKVRDRDQVVYRGTSKREFCHRYDPDGKRWDCRDYRHEPLASEAKGAAKPSRREESSPASRASNGIRETANNPSAPGRLFSRNHEARKRSNDPESMPDEPENKALMDDPAVKPGTSCLVCSESIKKVSRLVMVDQLWMWILDDSTIITCFPKRYGVNRQDMSGIHKAIRRRLNGMKDDCIHSVYDIALVVIDECSSLFFDRTKTDERQPQMVEIFSQAITDLSQKHARSFDHFSRWADELAKVSKKSSLIDLSTLHAAILSITSEVRLQRETKNIMDELGIMISLLKKQKQLLERFIRLTGSLLEPESERTAATSKSTTPQTRAQERQNEERGNTDLRIFKAKADEVSQETESHLEELKGLLESAEGVGKNLDQFVALKQQQASVVQAWLAIRHGEEAVSQGRAIMIFTVITIIFLPLAFMAAIFGMNNDALGSDNMSIQLQLKLMFTISLAVIVVVVGIAFGSGFRHLVWSAWAWHYCANSMLVRSGLYEKWLKVPERMRIAGMVSRSETAVQDMKNDVRKGVLTDVWERRMQTVRGRRLEKPENEQYGTLRASCNGDAAGE